MLFTYIASDNTGTNGTALGAAGQDVRVYKVIVGLPVDGKYVAIFNSAVAVGGATTNLAAKITQPTAAAGKDWVREIDFTTGDSQGLQLDGGAVHTNSSQVTVLWEVADQTE